MAKTAPAVTENEREIAPPPPKSHHRGRGRPRADESPAEDSHSFFETLLKVDARDWGTRYWIYLYRLEPTIDRTRTGEPKYIQSYAEPINEDRILADQGSGKYKMILNFRKPGIDRGDEIDTGYISILNMQFPPRIAPGEWVDDPKNRKWSWAKKYFPAEQPQGNNGAADPMKTLETYNKIRKDIVAEVQPHQPETEPEERMLTLAAVIEKMVPKQDLNSIAALLKELRPQEDKLSQFLLQQHTTLMTKFLEAKEGDNKTNNGIGMIREVVNGLRELLPTAKDLIPGLGDGPGHRSRLNSWQELTVAVAPFAAQILTPLSGMLAHVIATRVTGGPGQATQLPALPATTPATMMPFLQMISAPMMNYARLIATPEQLDPGELGGDFASWVHEGFSSNPNYDAAIVAARGMGTVGIMAAFRGTPLWTDKGPQANLPSLAELEAKLPAFFEAFLNWRPSQAEDEDDTAEEVTTFSEKRPPVN